jgi:integrase
MDTGVFVDRSHAEQTTLADILERYRNTVTTLKRGQKQEQSRISVVLAHPIVRQALATLRAGDFAVYRDDRLQQVSDTTVNKELNLFAHVIDTARREWSIHIENPVRLIKRPKCNRAWDRRLDPGEGGGLVAAAKLSGSAKIIEFALETAMRRGELVGMRWTHVDFANRVLHIPVTETDTPRYIPFSSKAVEILRGLPRRIEGRVFGVRSQRITQAFERACLRAGIVDLTFHDLRHEAASRLFDRGLNPMQVAAITSHKTLQMLKRYTHLRAVDLVALLA